MAICRRKPTAPLSVGGGAFVLAIGDKTLLACAGLYSSSLHDLTFQLLPGLDKQLTGVMVSAMKIIGWIVQHGWVLLVVVGLLAYIGFTQIKGKCPLCVVLKKIDAQTTNDASAWEWH